ncbi:hypothetical protein ACFLX8_01805 [Chloroflexota bacterium]
MIDYLTDETPAEIRSQPASVINNHLRETIRRLYWYFCLRRGAFTWLGFNSQTAP